jgi:Glycosyl hydrolases family 16
MSKNKTKILSENDVNCDYNEREGLCKLKGNEFKIKFRGGEGPVGKGSRFSTSEFFTEGAVSACIKTPKGDTSGLCSAFYLSSGESEGKNPKQVILFRYLICMFIVVFSFFLFLLD